MTKEQEFILAIRKLERQYGLYLSTSEWMSVDNEEPDLRDGVFSACPTREETEDLARVAEEQGL